MTKFAKGSKVPKGKEKTNKKKISPKSTRRQDANLTDSPSTIRMCSTSGIQSANVTKVKVKVLPDMVTVYEPQELDSGEEANAKDLKNMQDVVRIYGDEVEVAKSYLERFLKEVFNPELSMSPYKSFVMRQTSLAAYSIAARMKTNRLHYLDVRDHLENLACLFDFMQIRNKEAAAYLAMLLSRMIGFVGPVAEVLEDIAKKHCTDWVRLEEFYMLKHEELVKEISVTCEKLRVPRLSDFSSPQCVATGNFGSAFKVIYADSIPVFSKIAPRQKANRENVVSRCSISRKFALSCTLVGCMAKHVLIAQVYSCFLSLSHYVVVMENVEGITLQQLIDREGILAREITAVVLAQICLAVEYMHCVGFIHRNLCPKNIMVAKMCRVRIIDFATVKACSGMYSLRMLYTFRKRTSKEFNDREVVGSLHYRAPELLRRQPYGRAIDWWAVGAVGFLMKFGCIPFPGNTEQDVITEILSGNFTSKFESADDMAGRPIISGAYNDLIQRLLRVKANSRLCSKSYEDYRKHPFFGSLNWEALERSEEIFLVPRIQEFLESEGAIDAGSSRKTEILTEFDSLKDCSKQFPLFTFNSNGFLRTQDALKAKQKVTPEMLDEPIELIGTFKENEPYKFQDWYKATRL